MTLEENVREVNSVLVAIKDKIVECGVEVAEGTHTRDYATKVKEVYEAGKKSQYDEFWDNYQDYGNKAIYLYAFAGLGWTDETFKPKYDIKPTDTAQGAFSENKITDFRSEAIGVEIDTSQATICTQLFIRSKVKYIGTISLESATNFDYAFYQCSELESIEKIILKEDGTNSLTSAFNYCSNLKEVKFEGVLGLNNLNLQWSTKLSKASITSVINALSTTTSGLSVTLTKLAVNKGFETSEGANDGITSAEWTTLIGTRSNWTINLI